MIQFDKRLSKFLNLVSNKQKLEILKSAHIADQNYKSAANLGEEIKPIDNEIAELIQTIKNAIENVTLSGENLY